MSNSTTFEQTRTSNSQVNKRGYETWFDRVGDSWLAKAPTVLGEETPVRLEYFRQVLPNGVKGLQVLDLGLGGMGTIAEALCRQGAKVTSLDQHERTLQLAEAHARQAGLDISFRQGEFHELPFADQSFEVVYAFDLLEHAGPRLERWLNEIRRVLKPEGVFLYNMPNRTATSRMMLIYIFEQVIKLNPPGHHNFDWFMKPSEMRAALLKSDLIHRHQTGFMNLQPKPIAGLNVLRRQGAPGGFKLGKDDSLVYVGYAVRKD